MFCVFSLKHKVTTNLTNNLGKFERKKNTKRHKTQPVEKNCNEEKNTKRHKTQKNTFGHSLPYNEPHMGKPVPSDLDEFSDFSQIGVDTPPPYFGNYLAFFPQTIWKIPQKIARIFLGLKIPHQKCSPKICIFYATPI